MLAKDEVVGLYLYKTVTLYGIKKIRQRMRQVLFSETKVETRGRLIEWRNDDAIAAGSSGSRSRSISRNSKSSFPDSHRLICLCFFPQFSLFFILSRVRSLSCGFHGVETELDKKKGLEELRMSYGEKRNCSDTS